MRDRISANVRVVISAVAAHMMIVVLIASAVLNVVLSRELRGAQPKTNAESLIGVAVTPLVGTTADGQRLTVTFDTSLPTLLYYFSSDCSWCQRNEPNVETLFRHVRGAYRVVAASTAVPAGARPEFLPDDAIVIGGLDAATLDTYQLHGTPQTMVISPYGRVVRSWPGAYQRDSLHEVSAFFGVGLPGLQLTKPSR
jgi:hypothetical protein